MKTIKRKIIDLINECIQKKEEATELIGIVNVHPKFNSNYEIQIVTLIASISSAITKAFSQCYVFITTIEIFMLITGTMHILVLIKCLRIFCCECNSCSSFNYMILME